MRQERTVLKLELGTRSRRKFEKSAVSWRPPALFFIYSSELSDVNARVSLCSMGEVWAIISASWPFLRYFELNLTSDDGTTYHSRRWDEAEFADEHSFRERSRNMNFLSFHGER